MHSYFSMQQIKICYKIYFLCSSTHTVSTLYSLNTEIIRQISFILPYVPFNNCFTHVKRLYVKKTLFPHIEVTPIVVRDRCPEITLHDTGLPFQGHLHIKCDFHSHSQTLSKGTANGCVNGPAFEVAPGSRMKSESPSYELSTLTRLISDS